MKYIAQINIAQMKDALDSPVMKEFNDFLAPINKLAEESPGFVWRMKDEEEEAIISGNTPFEDDMLIINMSVWESIEQLKDFVYDTAHSYFVKSRKKWFNQMESQHMALWWVDPTNMPSLEEAADKLKQLDQEGASEEVFDFKWALKNL
ncbi:MAG: DUF3291 domain-containing protein [bacterium]|nr:DUF3291 domain-containing protein [bacterium]